MKITFLGTGTSQGIPVIGCDCAVCHSPNHKNIRSRSSVFIDGPMGKILIDTGPDLRMQLLKNKIDDVDFILYTHEHNDHTAGLDDIRPINFRNQKIVNAYGLERVIDDIKIRFHYAFDDNPYPGSPQIELIPVTKHSILMDNIFCISINHGNIDILGYRIGNFAYLTDVKFIEDIELEKLKNLDAVVISALQIKSHHSHQSLAEAIILAQKINAKKTYLTHMSHTMGLVESWSTQLPESIMPAYDGLILQL